MKLDVFRRAVLASNLMQFEIRVVLPQPHATSCSPVLSCAYRAERHPGNFGSRGLALRYYFPD